MPIKVILPGSKSITNRALILAALYGKNTVISHAALCDDTKYMIEGLRKLGFKIIQKDTTVQVKGTFKKINSPITIYTDNAGTTTRFLTALSTLSGNTVVISGSKRMHERPINPLTEALNQIGAKVETRNGCPPVIIYPQTPQGGIASIPAYISSQYISALLMIGSSLKNELKLELQGKIASEPYIKMTEKMLIQFQENPFTYHVEGDASCASYFGAYSALNHHKPVKLNNIYQPSLQGDIAFLRLLEEMGCTITTTGEGTMIRGPKKLKSLGEIDMNAWPDLVMTFAVLAMFANGKTKIHNIANLRIKETDRIKALENEIQKFGVKVESGKDYLVIEGKLMTEKIYNEKIAIETYEDHRMAMCFGILKNNFPGLTIKNPQCVNKSYPDFFKDLKKVMT